MFVNRYTIGASPAMYLLVALGIITARRLVPVPISVGVLIVLIAPGLHHYYVDDVQEQWREVAVYLEQNASQRDTIVYAPEGPEVFDRAFRWYYQNDLPRCGSDEHLKNVAAITARLEQCAPGHQQVWLVVRGTTESIRLFTSALQTYDNRLLRLQEARAFTSLTVFRYAVTHS
jgi:hypothetical protein